MEGGSHNRPTPVCASDHPHTFRVLVEVQRVIHQQPEDNLQEDNPLVSMVELLLLVQLSGESSSQRQNRNRFLAAFRYQSSYAVSIVLPQVVCPDLLSPANAFAARPLLILWHDSNVVV